MLEQPQENAGTEIAKSKENSDTGPKDFVIKSVDRLFIS